MMTRKQTLRVQFQALSAGTALAVFAGCGGGGGSDAPPPPPPTATISGVVADGPLQGANACYDSNDNARCDAGEPTSAASDANGNYTITVPEAAAGKHAVIVDVPASAVDRDTGAAVGTAFVLKAPASGSAGSQTVFVSPLTTVVVDMARQQAIATADAVTQVRQLLGMSASPLANYVATPDAQAATLATTINRVIIDIQALAAAASVPAEQARALVEASTTGNLASLAAQVAAASGTPQAVAQQVSASIRADANLTPATVAAQAQAQALLAAPLQAQSAGPFVSVRQFTYNDANNYSYRAFVGDSSQVDAQGRYVAHELRKNVVGGVDQAFNRNRAYWTGGEWKVCERQWAVSLSVNQSASAPSSSRFCDASVSQTRVASEDISGRRMADVVAAMRAYPLPDTDGLPTAWGPNPTLLGDATFPTGSALSSRTSVTEIGNTDSYGLLDKVLARAPDGLRRHLASFDDDGVDDSWSIGNFADANAVVSGANAAFLDQYTVAQPADATLLDAARWLIAFDPAANSNRVRFFKCDVVRATNAEANCAASGDGTIGAPESRGDARIARIASGYPVELLKATNRQRFFIERDGAVLRGSTDLQRTSYHQRLNTTAWTALRDQLGISAHAVPTAPVTAGPFRNLRSFTFTDLANYNLREVYGDSSVVDSGGFYQVSERREIKSGGVAQPFVRNRLYWTGSAWFYCPDDGANITRQATTAPLASVFCGSYEDESFTRTDITLDGRRMSDVVRDFRRYGSRDGSFDYRNWGPNPNVHTQLANAFFPDGAVMQVRSFVRKVTPIAIAVGAGDRVRVPPADSSVPFETWPFAASLDDFIAKYPGNLNAGPLNGATAFWVWGYDLPAPPAPEFTTRVEIRVAFDVNGQKARFYRNYKLASTGGTTAYMPLLDTTYTVQTLGDTRVLGFAALPAGFEHDFKFQRFFAERSGTVWYAFKDSVTPEPLYSLRLNSTGRTALYGALGLQ